VDYTLRQSNLVIHPCIDLLALPAATLPAIDTTLRFWISKRSGHRFLGRSQSILRGKYFVPIKFCDPAGPALSSICVIHQQFAGSKLFADRTSCTLCRI
jgi:hypothetical protein